MAYPILSTPYLICYTCLTKTWISFLSYIRVNSMISKWIMISRCYKLYKYALKGWRKKDVTMLQSLLRFPSFSVQAPKLWNIKKKGNLNRPITGLTNHPYMVYWLHKTPLCVIRYWSKIEIIIIRLFQALKFGIHLIYIFRTSPLRGLSNWWRIE